jgi:TolB-like protein
MSPEQAKGQPADYRSDQFSFGAILYEMVTGKRAFQRDLSVQTLSAIIEQEPAAIAVIHPETPPHLRVTVERCLTKNPEERYDSTRDLARELKSIGEIATPLPSQPTAAPSKKRRTWPRIMAIAGGMAAVLALAFALNVGGLRDGSIGEPNAPLFDSIAVLPLENLSGDPEQEYFADGMTEELIAELAKIAALRVISRQSVMQFKDTDTPLPEIAQALNVDALVEGSVRRSGDRVRITTQLVQTNPERHLWAESYERDLRDILALQSEVAQAIAREIRIAVTPAEASHLSNTSSVDPEAYQLYLRGRFEWNKRSPEGFKRSLDFFQQAIGEDPDYALAYAGVADCYSMLASYDILRPEEAYP